MQGVTTWVLDEAEELDDEATFDKINLSVRQKGVQNRVVLILNPTTKEHWIYKRFFEQQGIAEGFNGVKGDTTYLHTTYKDNLDNLDGSFLNDIERIKSSNPSKFKHQILGGWLDKAEGVVFTNLAIGEWHEHLDPVFGQDYGFSNDPTTLVKVAIEKDNIYIKAIFGKTGLSTNDIYELNKAATNNRSLIVGDSAEPRLISELRRMGNNLKPCIKGQGSVTAGIKAMQGYNLIVCDSPEIVKELNNYVWHDKRAGVPVDMFNHYIDAVRYAVTDLVRRQNAKSFIGK